MKHRISKTWACDPANVGVARSWLTQEVRAVVPHASYANVGDAQLVVSELVTNAMRAGCARVTVHLSIEDECVRVGVEDAAPGRPQRRRATNTDVTGRGLGIVAALASDWGVRRTSDGKEVWAAIQFS